ncbi:MAG TPA: hypothetical protein DCS93_25045 [Microscillaceae bacterium]|nr:hypothetical protein [Microscillaceae bacterium]
MRKIYSMLMLATLIGFSACQTYLEEPQPQQGLPLATAYQTPSDIRNALFGVYNRFQDDDLYGGNYVLYADLMSNNIEWGGSFNAPGEIAQLQIAANNGDITATYNNVYILSNNIAAILQVIDNIEGLDAAERDRIKGELYFMRGMAYFEAIRYYGKPYSAATSASDPGLPISLTYVDDLSKIEKLPRQTVAQVYTQAINDLQQAETLIPTDFASNGRATHWAAKSALAEIYFQQGDYTRAATKSNEIIASGNFALNNTVDVFYETEFSGESIMEVNMTVQDNPGVNAGLTTFYANGGIGGRGDITITPDMFTNGYDQIVTTAQQTALTTANQTVVDQRLSVLTNRTSSFVLKYTDGVNNADNIPVYRYAEILLMRAEALARTAGVTAEAVNLLNEVRGRALVVSDAGGNAVADTPVLFQTTDFANAQALIDAIVLERRVELAYEGNRFHDLRRLGLAVKGTAATANNLVFPIPQSAIDNNSALTQNPGY